MNLLEHNRRYIPEIHRSRHPLGRHVNHDPRSLAFRVAEAPASNLRSVTWARRVPIFDQGELGSCTGNASVGVLGTDPFFGTLPDSSRADRGMDETFAIGVYSDATIVDPFSGTYPTTDTGSDGLSVAKVLTTRGLISGYQHCTSLTAVITALQSGPVITGTNWYDSFDDPDSNGRVTIEPTAVVRGGHEYECVGVDLEQQLLHFAQSWGTTWGARGYFNMGFSDYERLLSEDGDATSFVPVTLPAPQGDPDLLFFQQTYAWAQARHYTTNRMAAQAALALFRAKGYIT